MKLWNCLLALAVATACNNDVTGLEPPSNPASETFAPSLGVNVPQMTKLANGTYIQDITIGTGAEVVTQTDTVWLTYAGFLKDGTLFDSGTNTRFEPTKVIRGFGTGIVGMKVGGERLLVIPSEMGYGPETKRNPLTNKITIPRQSTLVFRVTLLRLHTPSTTGTGTTA